ncbi:hypothetical protein BDR03DRAFT_1005575 [Suillus americanus]|nr:hypothetical protein BDR03DRAFT_1005575 [Suillus americanus]
MSHSCGFCSKEFPSRKSGSIKKHIAIHPEWRKKWEMLVADNEGGLPEDFSYNNSFSPLWRSCSSSFNPDEDNPVVSKNGRVTVEDAPDEDKDKEGQTSFKKYQKYKESEGENEWAPFCDEEEWELAEWLIKSLGQT